MDYLDVEIQQTFAEIKKQEKYIHKLEMISAKILEQEVLLAELATQKNKELNDVEILEAESLRNIFLFFLGKKEEMLEIERQEFLWAELNYTACESRILALKDEKAIIENEISKFHMANSYLNELLEKKQLELKKSSEEFELYKSINDRILYREQKVIEINEAMEIGSGLITLIANLTRELKNVKNWNGVFEDTFTKMNQGELTKSMMSEIDKNIQKFKAELEDIKLNFQLNFTSHLVIFENFISIFYDNLITDWVVQKQIDNANKSANVLFGKVERILLMLEHEHKKTHAEIDYYRSKRKDFLLKK